LGKNVEKTTKSRNKKAFNGTDSICIFEEAVYAIGNNGQNIDGDPEGR